MRGRLERHPRIPPRLLTGLRSGAAAAGGTALVVGWPTLAAALILLRPELGASVGAEAEREEELRQHGQATDAGEEAGDQDDGGQDGDGNRDLRGLRIAAQAEAAHHASEVEGEDEHELQEEGYDQHFLFPFVERCRSRS